MRSGNARWAIKQNNLVVSIFDSKRIITLAPYTLNLIVYLFHFLKS